MNFNNLDPRARTLIDLATLAILLLALKLNEAPDWAMVLGVIVGTRTPMLGSAVDRRATQDSILSVDRNVDRVHNLIDKLSRS
jgi:hypothetical protein